MTARGKPLADIVLGMATVLAAAGIAWAERRAPLRRQRHDAAPRIARNAVMGALCASVVALVERPVTRAIAARNLARRRGVAQILPAPLRPAAGFLVMDYGFYLWHVATHLWRPLWRLHRIHHIDPDMDMSTAVRFHMADMAVSLPWRMAQVRIAGIGPAALDAWQTFFTISILFHHANWRLPAGWDRRLAWLLTTPEMHGLHHSVIATQRDSNWSSGISWWDRLHGTYRCLPPPRAIVIGTGDARAAADLPLGPAHTAPFRSLPPRGSTGSEAWDADLTQDAANRRQHLGFSVESTLACNASVSDDAR